MTRTKYFSIDYAARLIVLRKFIGNSSYYFTNRNNTWIPSNISLFEIKMYSEWKPISRDAARKKYPKAFSNK